MRARRWFEPDCGQTTHDMSRRALEQPRSVAEATTAGAVTRPSRYRRPARRGNPPVQQAGAFPCRTLPAHAACACEIRIGNENSSDGGSASDKPVKSRKSTIISAAAGHPPPRRSSRHSAKSFGAVKTYGRSKLCNILFTRELARRLRDTGVTAHCLHPGFVATRFADQSGGLISHFAWLAKLFAISPAEGAKTIIYLASSADVAEMTGEYFYKCLPIIPSPAALNDQSALLLWQRSAALAGMKVEWGA